MRPTFAEFTHAIKTARYENFEIGGYFALSFIEEWLDSNSDYTEKSRLPDRFLEELEDHAFLFCQQDIMLDNPETAREFDQALQKHNEDGGTDIINMLQRYFPLNAESE